jgi:hypothetical protein
MACLTCLSAVDRWCHITECLGPIRGRSREGLYETTLADSEREAVADLLQYLENVGSSTPAVTCFFLDPLLLLHGTSRLRIVILCAACRNRLLFG